MSDKSKPLDPCELNLLAHYNTKNPQQIKSSVKYFREVLGNITDRGQLRIFIDQYAKTKGLEMSSRLLSELDTIGKHAINMDRIMNKLWNKDHVQAALSLYEETSSAVKGSGVNAERSIQIHQKAFWGAFDREMSGIGFSKEFANGVYDKEIRQVIRSGEAYKGANADQVNQAAGIIRKYYSIMNHELNSAGMRTAYRGDYDGPMVHDGSAIYGKFTEWVTALDEALDFHKEFPEVPTEEIKAFQRMVKDGSLKDNYDKAQADREAKYQYQKDFKEYSSSVVESKKKGSTTKPLPKPVEPETTHTPNQVQRILEYSYDKISATESALVDEVPRSLERPVSIAERRSYAKSFTTWKSGEAVQTYLNEFGKYKTMNEQMQYYARSAARDVGLTSVFGGSPFKGHQMNKELVNRLMRLDRKTPAEIDKAMRTLDSAWGHLTKPKIPEPNVAGEISMHTRAVTAQAKLGMAGFTSLIMDPVATALQHRNLMQEGIIKALWDSYTGTISSMGTATRGDLEDSHLFSQYDLSTTMEELYRMGGGVSTAGNRVSSALQFSGELVSKGSGAYFFNKTAHINNAKMYMKFLADASSGKKKINPVMMADLAKFGLTPDDLKIIKGMDLRENGMRSLTSLTPEDMMANHPNKYKDTVEAGHALVSFRERMNLWLLEKIKSGAPQAGNRERRILLGDTVAGTAEGEVRRFLTQFKATQTKVFIDSTYGANRRLNPEGMQAGKGVEWKNKENAYNLGAMAFLLTSAGAANMLLNAAISGNEKEMKRWSDGDPLLLLEAFGRGGAGNILGDLMSAKENKAQAVVQVLGSPAVTGLVTPFAATAQAIGGKPDKAALDIFKTFVPGANMWFLKPFVQGMSDAASNSSKARSGGRDPL